ncbi:MAG TPA: hypothetical protein VGD30_18485 [Telluria sp.]
MSAIDDKREGSEPVAIEAEFEKVPLDFPRPLHFGAVPGAQPKLLAVRYNGRFYSPGCTPPELYERWTVCEDLAQQLAAKSSESKAGKRSHLSEVAILDQYLPRLIATKWTTEAEARWTIRRVAAMLSWPVPPDALEPDVIVPTK